MNSRRQWAATHRAVLRNWQSGETFDLLLVMMVDDNKAYQEEEWRPAGQMGDPDIMKGPDGTWAFRLDDAKVTLEPL
jgi:hypothetical protein